MGPEAVNPVGTSFAETAEALLDPIVVSVDEEEEVVEDPKRVAPRLGYSRYQPLIRAYIGQGLRADLARLEGTDPALIAGILRRHGVADDVFETALAEYAAADRTARGLALRILDEVGIAITPRGRLRRP